MNDTISINQLDDIQVNLNLTDEYKEALFKLIGIMKHHGKNRITISSSILIDIFNTNDIGLAISKLNELIGLYELGDVRKVSYSRLNLIGNGRSYNHLIKDEDTFIVYLNDNTLNQLFSSGIISSNEYRSFRRSIVSTLDIFDIIQKTNNNILITNYNMEELIVDVKTMDELMEEKRIKHQEEHRAMIENHKAKMEQQPQRVIHLEENDNYNEFSNTIKPKSRFNL